MLRGGEAQGKLKQPLQQDTVDILLKVWSHITNEVKGTKSSSFYFAFTALDGSKVDELYKQLVSALPPSTLLPIMSDNVCNEIIDILFDV